MASDDGNPDLLRLKSSVDFPNRAERYEIKELEMPAPSPTRHSFLQMFDFGSILRQHPHKYKTMMREDAAAEDVANDDTVDSKTKLERKLAEKGKSRESRSPVRDKKASQQRVKSADKKGDGGEAAEGTKPKPKRSSSYANIHEMKKTVAQEESAKEPYYKSLSTELALGYDDYVYNHPVTDSEDEGEPVVVPRSPPIVIQSQEGSLIRRHSMSTFASFEEEPEMTTIQLPDGSAVKVPDVGSMSHSQPPSTDVTPVGTPQGSPRLRARHELAGGHTGCIPVDLQPERKKLFGIGPSYQPPSDQVCVHREDARQLGLLQRVVNEGFSATARTHYHQREDSDFFPPDQPQTQASIESAKDLKKRFITSADMNFLSPTSM